MASTNGNILLNGVSGRIGNMIYRQVNGKTVVSSVPDKRKKKKRSAAQLAAAERFRKATAEAKAILIDPKKKLRYEKLARRKQLPNAYTALLQEILNAEGSAASATQKVRSTKSAAIDVFLFDAKDNPLRVPFTLSQSKNVIVFRPAEPLPANATVRIVLGQSRSVKQK